MEWIGPLLFAVTLVALCLADLGSVKAFAVFIGLCVMGLAITQFRDDPGGIIVVIAVTGVPLAVLLGAKSFLLRKQTRRELKYGVTAEGDIDSLKRQLLSEAKAQSERNAALQKSIELLEKDRKGIWDSINDLRNKLTPKTLGLEPRRSRSDVPWGRDAETGRTIFAPKDTVLLGRDPESNAFVFRHPKTGRKYYR